MVGLEGDPLGRKDPGLPPSAPVVVVALKVVGTVEVMAGVEVSKVVPTIVVVGISSGSSNVTT